VFFDFTWAKTSLPTDAPADLPKSLQSDTPLAGPLRDRFRTLRCSDRISGSIGRGICERPQKFLHPNRVFLD